MLSRRQVLRGGFGALATVMVPGARRMVSGAPPAVSSVIDRTRRTAPLVRLPLGQRSITIDGLPFMPRMTGDPYPYPHMRFPSPAEWLENDQPPPPTEEVDVAIIGGGISGLSSAYLLRDHEPVVFELNDRFGGSARGEAWGGVSYSMGGAYVITPDPGTSLDVLYSELGLDVDHRLHAGASEVELNGRLLAEEFWTGQGLDVPDLTPYQRYAEVVQYMANEAYPEIPLPAGPAANATIALDRKTFRQDIEDQMGMPMPPLLAAGVQAYCYSSFGAGAEEISAASGWNFLAAEEFGRWVFDGGNAQMAQRFWQAIASREHPGYRGLRAGALVVDVRLQPRGVQVTWADTSNALHSLLARRVVMACPKNVARRVLQDVQRLDPEKATAMERVHHTGYIVANVLLDAPVDLDFYDIFLLGDGSFPTSQAEAEQSRRVVDMLNGRYFDGPAPGPRGVLTLYWPLPWSFGQHTLLQGKSTFGDYAHRLAPQVREMLSLLGVAESAVRQVRMSYFGHAMPIAFPGFIAEGAAEAVRRPFEGQVYFVQQDNWALPAVENCLLDAVHYTQQVAADLR